VDAFDIYDADYLKKIGGDAAKMNDNPVGTGPYIVKEWVRGDHITLVPNPTYFGEKPANNELIFKWNKESAARLLDLQAGNVNGIVEVTADDIATIQADPNLVLVPRKFNNFLYLGINNSRAPFDNEKVRQAFAMAIDKQKIVDDFYTPGSVPATQFAPAGVKPGYTEGYKGVAYDPAKAKEMLTAEKFDFSKEYTLAYAFRTRPYFPQPDKIAEAVQAQLGEIGIKIKLSQEEWATYLPATRNGEKDLFFLGWSEDYPDATNWYDVFLTGTSKSFGTAYPDIVERIQKAAKLSDPVARQKLYDEVNVLVDQHVPMITIANGTTNFAFQKSVENVVMGPYDYNLPYMKTPNGTMIFSQDGEPVSLFCADETDGSSFNVCLRLFSKLYTFKWGTAELEPQLAEKCEGNADATEWTCTLKKDVKFSNGAALDANDVVVTFASAMDFKHPLHKGNTGTYQYFKDLILGTAKLINEP
jgi:ABC-type transport system substrate-binding protein